MPVRDFGGDRRWEVVGEPRALATHGEHPDPPFSGPEFLELQVPGFRVIPHLMPVFKRLLREPGIPVERDVDVFGGRVAGVRDLVYEHCFLRRVLELLSNVVDPALT